MRRVTDGEGDGTEAQTETRRRRRRDGDGMEAGRRHGSQSRLHKKRDGIMAGRLVTRPPRSSHPSLFPSPVSSLSCGVRYTV